MAEAPVHRPAAEPAHAAVAAPVVEAAPAPAPIIEAAPVVAPVAAEPKADAPVQPELKRADAEPTLAELAGGNGDVPTPALDEPVKPGVEDPKPADAPKPEDKPADDPAKPVEAPVEAKPEAPKVEPVKYEPFVLPDGARPDDPKFLEATTVMSELGIPQDKAQALIGHHVGAMNDYAAHLAQRQHDAFAETRHGWRVETMADAQMGGAGWKTSQAAIGRMRDLFVPKEERKAFDDMCRLTGCGDHPVFNRLLWRIAQRFDEPAPAPQPASPAPDRGGSAKRSRYTHPSSVARREAGA